MMQHLSSYLDWYVHVPQVKYDLRSSGTEHFKHDLVLEDVDLSTNYAYGNPEATKLLAERYSVRPENVFISSEGASGQNLRIIKCLAEMCKRKNEAIVEYPTYEPLLRQMQEYFPHLKRLERKAKDTYRLDAEALRKIVSEKTGLLVLTNPHAPSGAVARAEELREVMNVAREYDFHVLSDEIYAEFDRKITPTLFSIDPELGIATTSLTKAYGLGGLKFGTALARKELVSKCYADTLSTVGNSPNIVQLFAVELLTRGKDDLEKHKQKWMRLKKETEKWLNEKNLGYFPNKAGITYWVKTAVKDTCKWINEETIPKHNLALVPGAFFLFKNGYRLETSNFVRLGLGNVNPDNSNLAKAFETLEEAFGSAKLKT
jgi:aspartate/methionine/tyrosine aminotransferase